jgi:aminoglycoside phosphotransferase (APT) family kinase protein
VSAATSSDGSGLDADAVERFLQGKAPGLSGAMRAQKISGGQSNPTYLLHFPARTVVLRKQPPGPLLPSAHAVDREYRVMAALGATAVPVPEMLLFCDDARVTGTPFYLMSAVEGRVSHDSALPDLSPPERRDAYLALADTLADLHAVEPAAVGLGDFGRPTDYFARQIRRWSEQYETDRTRDLPGMDRLIDWLRANLPGDDGLSGICHGDYRIGNVMFAPDAPRIVAVLDWELSTLGHPLADLAYCLMFWRLTPEAFSGLGGLDLGALCIPDEAAFTARYFARRGLPDTLTPFHRAFAFFRFALIVEGVAARARKGNAASDDARAVGDKAVLFTDTALAIIDGAAPPA